MESRLLFCSVLRKHPDLAAVLVWHS